VAIDDACYGKSKPGGQSAPGNEGSDWCAIVATSHGRVVRLRRHIHKKDLLVPEAIVWNVLEDEDRNSELGAELLGTSVMHVLPSGILVKLRSSRRTVHAIHAASGRRIGEWQLPENPGHTWSSIAGGDKYIYIVSLSMKGESSELWRFPLPPALRSAMFVATKGLATAVE